MNTEAYLNGNRIICLEFSLGGYVIDRSYEHWWDAWDELIKPEKVKSLTDICIGFIVKNNIEYNNKILTEPCCEMISEYINLNNLN